MVIEVTTQDETITFRTGEKWVIDDNELLHIVGPDGNLASFNRGKWNLVGQRDESRTTP